MGHGIHFNTQIFLNRIEFHSEYEIIDKKNELEESINRSKGLLKMLSSSNPRDVVPEDWKDDPLNWIATNVDDLINSIQEESILLYQLSLYLDVYNEHKNTNK